MTTTDSRTQQPRATETLGSSMVVGASRGLGRGVATALARAGSTVIAVARSAAPLEELAKEASGVVPEVADASDPSVPGVLLDRHQPDNVVIVAGAGPLMRPLQQQTWETFSVNWNTDVRITFQWLRESLLVPLRPGSRVIVVSSGAALGGSPLSGGYAGAKATQRFITAYAQEEAGRAGLDIAYTAVLPQLTPMTGLGQTAVRAYAARAGRSYEEHARQLGEVLTPDATGAALVQLLRTHPGELAPAYRLSAAGLAALS
jgi:NAD(P)-dependent dehydrogenase (short-subunit alcohol dehydrogenase family)